jgi:hypothetical protein
MVIMGGENETGTVTTTYDYRDHCTQTNDEHFKIFKQECIRWIDIFGLTDWCIDIEHKDKRRLTFGARGSCRPVLDNKCAVISLNKEWIGEVTEKALKRTAFHEVLHILLYRLSWLAERNNYMGKEVHEYEISQEVHGIINRMENAFLE